MTNEVAPVKRRRGERGPSKRRDVERAGYRIWEVAEMLGCSENPVRAAIAKGQLVQVTLSDETQIVPAWSVRRFLELPENESPNAAEQLLIQVIRHLAAGITSADVTVRAVQHDEGLRAVPGGKG